MSSIMSLIQYDLIISLGGWLGERVVFYLQYIHLFIYLYVRTHYLSVYILHHLYLQKLRFSKIKDIISITKQQQIHMIHKTISTSIIQ